MSPRLGPGPLAWLGLAAAVAAGGALLLLPGELGPAAARAGLVVAGLAGAGLLVHHRAAGGVPPRLRVVSQTGLARDAAVVLVELDGRPMLLDVERDGVRLLADPGWMGPEVEP